MVTKSYAMTAALGMKSESPIMLPTVAVPMNVVPTNTWHTTVVAPNTDVFAVSNSALASAHAIGDPRSRQAKQAAPPRGRFR